MSFHGFRNKLKLVLRWIMRNLGSPLDDEKSWFAVITFLRCPKLAISFPRSSLNYKGTQQERWELFTPETQPRVCPITWRIPLNGPPKLAS